jgi:hypothetical protein
VIGATHIKGFSQNPEKRKKTRKRTKIKTLVKQRDERKELT